MTSVSAADDSRRAVTGISRVSAGWLPRPEGSAVALPGGVFGRVIFALFLACQASDGLLTYVAVSAMGHAAEGNPILATWMQLAGTGPTLVGAKLIACACGCILYVHRTFRALAVLTALYLVGAIAPWLHVLIGR